MMRLSIFILLLVVTNSMGQTNTFPPDGNTGIGTTAPSFKLDVEGTAALGGGNGNIDKNNPSLADRLIPLQNSGKMMVGWNWSGGNGEIDLIANRAGGNAGGFHFFDYTNSGQMISLMRLNGNGNVGIGTDYPQKQLDIGGYTQFSLGRNMDPTITFGQSLHWVRFNSTTSSYAFWTNGQGESDENPQFFISHSGNVGIGVNAPVEKLEVNGSIRSKEVKVEATGWPDYVFQPQYKLVGLPEVEKYISENGHLPNIPSAASVSKEGISLGEMNARLLEKIEELTLYMIELKKENLKLLESVKKIEKKEN